MITVRQIEKLWSAKAYERLLEQLLFPRPESSDQLRKSLAGPLPAAAMAIIRLDELSQSYAGLYSELVRTVLNAQRADGGWGDVYTTALCVRALLCSNGDGAAVDRGLNYLANLQKPEGIWPGLPMRRMPVDPFASAFILMRLGDCKPFQDAVNMEQAIAWFEENDLALDPPTPQVMGSRPPTICANRHAGHTHPPPAILNMGSIPRRCVLVPG